MRIELAPVLTVLSAFCCPKCWSFLQQESDERWTLLRGNQLSRRVFVCRECGYESTRIQQEDD